MRDRVRVGEQGSEGSYLSCSETRQTKIKSRFLVPQRIISLRAVFPCPPLASYTALVLPT